MARPLRIEYAGALYHVTSRGDRREDIYHDDKDRLTWLDVFSQVCTRFNWRCHGWCLMDNHYHILIETAEGNLSQGMRQLNGVYTQRSNRRHGRVGHVFQGRYTERYTLHGTGSGLVFCLSPMLVSANGETPKNRICRCTVSCDLSR